MLIWTSRNIPNVGLFSAYAEVFLSFSRPKAVAVNFSLPTQRCFREAGLRKHCVELFSAYAEVFPAENAGDPTNAAFLCLRRGVSRSEGPTLRLSCFSLPTQRCFPEAGLSGVGRLLFSAYAEVFLST